MDCKYGWSCHHTIVTLAVTAVIIFVIVTATHVVTGTSVTIDVGNIVR